VERIHVGRGVYRSLENTQLFEVFTDEQMQDRAAGRMYNDEKGKSKGLKGGFHGMKVLAKKNKHGRTEYENAELVTKEQLEIIKRTVGILAPPEVAYSNPEVGAQPSVMKHDHSKDSEIHIPDNMPEEISEGTNLGGINPETGEPYDEEDHEPFDEGFIGDDDGNGDGYDEDAAGTDGEDGEAVGSPEPTEPEPEPEQSREPSGKPNKKSSK